MEQLNALQIGGDELDLGGRRIVGELGYDTVQAAWEDANDGDVVYVHSSYDAESAGEDFPIVIDQNVKEVALTGGHPSGSEINAEHAPDKNILEVYGRGSRDFRNTPLVTNLKLTGGNVGLQVVGAPGAVFRDLKFFRCNSHGAHITTTSDNDDSTFGTHWHDCEAWSCGGSGFRVDRAARGHGTTFNACKATWNGWNGNQSGVVLRGYSSVWRSGAIQRNSRFGIIMADGGSQILRDTYFESNGFEANYPIDAYATGTRGTVIEGCYFQGGMFGPSTHMDNVQGHDNVYRAITLHSTWGAHVRDCTYRNYRYGFISVQGSRGLDNDINEQSHYNIGGSDRFLVHDRGTRTRSNGVVREQNLENIDGNHTCDQGMHDGSGSAPWGPAVWNGSAWVSLIDGQEI